MSNITNQGLKKLSKNIILNVNEVTLYLNVNKYYSNVILDIPLISTYGHDPFNVGIFFNLKNENISEFGKGMRLSFYNHFYRHENGNVTITSCLDEEELYPINGEYNLETELKLTGSKIQDNKGNYYEYINSEQSYPSHIRDAVNNIDLYLSTSSEKIQRISNNEEDEINSSIVDFVYVNNLVEQVIYRRKLSSNQYEDIYKVRLEYDSSFYLTRLRYYRIGTNEETLVKEFTISYQSTFIIVEDVTLNKGIKVVISNNVITSYITKHSSGYLENPKATTTFEYGEGTTSLIDPDGKKITYGFTLDNKPLGISDYSYNYSFDEYDENLHLVKSIKGLCPYNQENLMIGIVPTGCIVMPHSETDISPYSFPRIYGDNYYLLELQSSNTAQFKLSKRIYKGEELILLCFVKRVISTSSSAINITLSVGNDYHVKSVKSNNELNEDVFDTILMVKNIEETIDEVNIEITTSSMDEIYIVPCLFLKKAITSYLYNVDNTIKEINCDGESIYYEYDNNNDLILTYGTNQIEERYELDDLRRISSLLSLYSNKYYSYSSSFPDQVISCRNKGNISKEEISEERTISSNGAYYTSITNSEGEVLLINGCNKYNEITSYTNEEAVTYSYTYDNEGRIILLDESYSTSSGTISRNASLQYNSYNKITRITSPCDSMYNFYYVDNDKLCFATAMGYNLIQYTYGAEYKKITSTIYGNDYYKEDYEYNDKELLTKIKTDETDLFTFLYDDFFRLTNINGQGEYRREYTYNSLGAVDTYLDNKINIKYNYNHYSSLESKVVKKNDDERYIKGEVVSSSLLVNEKSFIKVEKEYKESNLWLVGFENDASLRANNLVISPLTSINTTSSFIRTVQVSNDKTLTYELNDSSLSLNLGTCICFFFKLTSISTSQTIISLKSKNGNSEVRVEYTNNQFVLKVVSSSSSSYTLGYINQEVNIDEWNFCSLNIANKAYRLQRYVLEYGLQINSIKERFTNTSLQRIYMDTTIPSYLSFGCQYNGMLSSRMQGEIGGIIVSKNGYVDPYKVDNYYQETKRIFLALSRKYIYTSNINYLIDTQDLEHVSFYPLINGFTNMLETSSSSVNDIFYNENETKQIKKLFKYNEVLKASSLQGYGYSIQVKINCSSSFLVSFDFSLDEEVNKKQVLFEGKDASSNSIKVYIKANKQISFDVNGTTYDTGLNVSINTKHNITFLVKEESSYNRKIICYLDEGSYSINKLFSYFINGFDIILGRVKEGYSTSSTLGEEKEIEELHGSICDLTITNNAIYDVDGLKNKIQKVIKETKTDDLGRLIKEEIKENNLCYVQEYTYLRRSGSEQYTSFLVETTKQLINNAFIKEIKYSYDNLKRVTRVQERYNETSSFEEVENYTYDKRGYLVGDNDRTYEYDDNGNITKNGENIITYNSDNHLLVNSINRSQITYYSSLPLYPSTYKGMSLSFDGKRLISVTLPDGNHFEYKYNVDGLRIKRSGNRSGPVTYSYSGNKLILQESSSLKLEFLYDEKDKLYGFIKNNNERYYYIRDALGNILGIINQNGQIVVQYSYTSYGTCSISGNTSLGNENPFRYKGYYYDVETSLYYLTTRYYDPEIGRFISPDSVDYLNPTTINGLNLYAYSQNNPIMYYDPTGHFAITLTTLLIGGLITGAIGAGIGLGTAVYKDVKEDGVLFNGDCTDYVGRTLGGFVAGFGVGICTVLGAGVGAAALGGTTATLFTSTGLTLSLESALGIGSGVAFATGMAGYTVRTVISRSEDYKVQNMFIEGGFNAISGTLSVLGGYLGGMAGVHNTVFTKLLSQKGDFWLRLLVENVFTAGFKLTNALIKPYFMI